MDLPGGFEIEVAGKDVVEDGVDPRQDDGIGFHPFKVGGVMPAGDDVAFGIGGLALEVQWGIAVLLVWFVLLIRVLGTYPCTFMSAAYDKHHRLNSGTTPPSKAACGGIPLALTIASPTDS